MPTAFCTATMFSGSGLGYPKRFIRLFSSTIIRYERMWRTLWSYYFRTMSPEQLYLTGWFTRTRIWAIPHP